MSSPPPIQRLVMVGACYIDTILSVPSYPQEDEKLRATSLEKRRGGNVANTLEVLAQLFDSHNPSSRPPDLHLLCVLPSLTSDATGFVRDSFGPSARVDLSLCVHRPDHDSAASSFIIRAADRSSRTIVNYNDLPEMTISEFQHQITNDTRIHGRSPSPDNIGPRTWFHFEGRNPAASVLCMRWLRSRYPHAVLSAEIEKPGREGLDLMAREADVIFFAKSWAVASTSSGTTPTTATKGGCVDAVSTFLRAQAAGLGRATLLTCTWGAEGAAAIRPGDGEIYFERAWGEVGREVVDTVGAGDTFIAGVLYKLLTSGEEVWDVRAALGFANRLAGRKVLQHGFANLG